MTRSMTAFARTSSHDERGELVWEIRSVNHRYLEMFLRLPENLRVLEPLVRARMNDRLGRGKLDIGLRFKPSTVTTSALQINHELTDQLMAVATTLRKKIPDSPLPRIMDVMRWPGILEAEEADFTPVQKAAVAVLEQAIDELIVARESEGARLKEMILHRYAAMREQIERTRVLVPQVIAGVRERLTARLEEISDTLDSERIEQEMVLLAQRLDVDEEMDRLTVHLDEVESVLKRDEPVGRRLDFLMQELNREANTLGSKSSSSETTAVTVKQFPFFYNPRHLVQNIE